MSYIYVYTNSYFNNVNYRKIGCTFNPFIRLESYLTYYLDRGTLEFLFKIDTPDLFQIEKKLKTEYLFKNNSRNNGFDGGADIFKNNNIHINIINCFKDNNIKWKELDPKNPPITKNYTNINEKNLLKEYRKTNKNITYDKCIFKIPDRNQLLNELKPIQKEKPEKFLELCKIIESYLNIKKPDIYCSYLVSQNLFDNNKVKDINPAHASTNNNLKILGTKMNIIDHDGKFFASYNPDLTISGFSISNSLVIFDVEILDYKCDNHICNSKNGKISDLIFNSPSKVGTPYGHIEIPEIRKSKYCLSSFDFKGPSTKHDLKQLVLENIKHIVPNEDIDNLYWNTKLKYTVLEYNEGDFFSAHSDSKKNNKHYATLLIFPPSEKDLIHTGGNLIITTEDTDVVFSSSLNSVYKEPINSESGIENWKFVAFHSNLKHECLPILSGRRVVLKTELMFKTNHFKHFIEGPLNGPTDGGILCPSPEPIED